LSRVEEVQFQFPDRDHLWIAYALQILLAPLAKVTIEILLERDLSAEVESICARIPLTIREAEETDLDHITSLYSEDPYLYLGHLPVTSRGTSARTIEPAAREQYRNRLMRGEKCFLALVGSEIAHINWVCFSWGEAMPGHPIFLQADEVYTTDAFTPPTFRGQNIHAMVLSYMLRHAQHQRRRRAYTVTRLDRRASFGALRQLRWRVAGQVLCIIPRGTDRSWLLKLSGRIDPLLRAPIPRIQ
jgi:hypothetical protein